MDKPKEQINDIGLLVVNRIEAMLAYWDKDLVCKFANNAYMDWFGKSREEMVDKMTLKELLGPLFEKNLPYIKEVLKGNTQHFEREIKTPIGEIRNSSTSYYPDFCEGHVRGFSVHVTDITDRRKAEVALLISEEKFQKAFLASAAGIAITNLSDSTFVEVNEAFSKMIGHSVEAIIGRTSIELGLIVNFDKREEALDDIRQSSSAKIFEMSLRHKTGNIIEVLSSVETILVNDVKYAIIIIYDITQRKLAEQQLEEVNKELEAFTYSVSHDLRAPLRAINGYTHMLNEDYGSKLDTEGKRIINTICNNAIAMGTLIDELLAFSKLGRKEVHCSKIDMNELVESVIADMDKSLTNRAEIRISTLPVVRADYGMFRQLIFNLIANALKYSSKKEHPIIELFSEEREGEIVFSVKDNGAGFDMKYYDKLFGVFQRLHKQSEFDGVGVGLAIVQRVITKHGGKVWAEGRVNEGAVFKFSLLTTLK